MDAATCANIVWVITGNFSGDSAELIKVRRILAEAIFNTDGKGFPTPFDPPAKVLASDEWTACKNAVLEAAKKLADEDPKKNPPIKFILFVPNGPEDKPDTESADLDISWPQSSKFTDLAGPVFDGSNRKIHLLSYQSINQEKALSEPGMGREGLYPIRLRDLLPPKISSIQPPLNKKNSPIAFMLFALAITIGIISMTWIYDVTGLIRTNANLILSKTTVEIDPSTKKIKSIVMSDEDKILPQPEIDNSINEIKKRCPDNKCTAEEKKHLDEEIKILEDKKESLKKAQLARFEKERLCIEKINEQLKKDSITSQDHKHCSVVLLTAENIGETKNRMVKFFRDKSFNDSRFSLFGPFVLSQVAILTLVLAAGFSIKGRPLGAFINTRNRMSLSSIQQILWLILLFGGITILGIFNIALLADFARMASQYKIPVDSLDMLVFFPGADPALWAALGLTAVVSPYISKRINSPASGNFDSLEARQDKSDTTGQSVSSQEANWTDIFTDEKQENSNTVDISRLQHLVITGLLLGGYFILLAEYVSNINIASIFFALVSGHAVFTEMPPVDGTFIGLMAISHTGYLAFKALPQKTNN